MLSKRCRVHTPWGLNQSVFYSFSYFSSTVWEFSKPEKLEYSITNTRMFMCIGKSPTLLKNWGSLGSCETHVVGQTYVADYFRLWGHSSIVGLCWWKFHYAKHDYFGSCSLSCLCPCVYTSHFNFLNCRSHDTWWFVSSELPKQCVLS